MAGADTKHQSAAKPPASAPVGVAAAAAPLPALVAAAAANPSGAPVSAFRRDVWPRARNFIGGYVSGMALVLVGHPFDSIKTRLQIEGEHGRFRGPLHAVQETWRHEGLRGFYKGLSPPLLATGIVNSVLFGLQGVTLHVMGKYQRLAPADPRFQYHPVQVGQAAIVTGFLISSLVTPMEAVKSRLQIQYNNAKAAGAAGAAGAAAGAPPATYYNGPIDCARQVVAKLGVTRGLYRGWAAVALCRMSNWSYFGCYEYFKQRLTPAGQTAGKLAMGPAVAAGGMAGICYWLSCYPMDVIKARLLGAPDVSPPKYHGIAHCAREIYRTEGAKAFFKGFTPCILRAFPANAAAFTAFEVMMSLLPP